MARDLGTSGSSPSAMERAINLMRHHEGMAEAAHLMLKTHNRLAGEYRHEVAERMDAAGAVRVWHAGVQYSLAANGRDVTAFACPRAADVTPAPAEVVLVDEDEDEGAETIPVAAGRTA
jgi:hypothetical protein